MAAGRITEEKRREAKELNAPRSTKPPRTVRHGKWFVLHSAYLLEIEHLESCDIHAEFLRDHPNGGARTAGLVAVSLSDDQIAAMRHRIRISSYRWDDCKNNAEGVSIPGNYFNFLDHIRERKQLLWMDWMANVGVNVPVPETLNYMGMLYAECIVLGDWMLDLDRVGTALTRTWIYQEMAFGALDEQEMGRIFEQLRERGRKVINDPSNDEAVKSYVLGCGQVASLLGRRAFGVMAAACEWFQAICGGIYDRGIYDNLAALNIENQLATVAYHAAKADVPSLDEDLMSRLVILCSPKAVKGWDGEWDSRRPELLKIVCDAPYLSCGRFDELVQRYAKGLLGAALGCEVTVESDRPVAVTAVLLSIALKRFAMQLDLQAIIHMAWQFVLEEMASTGLDGAFFYVNKVHAEIKAGCSFFALDPLQLKGTHVTYSQNTGPSTDPPWGKLTCHYTTTDSSKVTFNGNSWVVRSAVQGAGMRGLVCGDTMTGLPEDPLPKPQDASNQEADICLCVPGVKPFATIARGFTFVLITQKEVAVLQKQKKVLDADESAVKGDRVVSMTVLSKQGASHRSDCDVQGKPPRPDICFYCAQ